jgi:diadenosine tetraphosphate (Ap4A) HIT family hydrolase|tara:strand:+ start:444 stop:794 length:351 start_codon:yes stop_codon:yes gene_type:complete
MTKSKKYPWTKPIGETNHYKVYRDKYPVTEGHLLFVPKEDLECYIDKCFIGAYAQGQALVKEGFIDGYNIGMNMGAAAGQTVMYPHIHFIPRNDGDMDNPRGGVRHVIPEKGNYGS